MIYYFEIMTYHFESMIYYFEIMTYHFENMIYVLFWEYDLSLAPI